MLDALQRVLGQLDLAYCVLEKQKIVWANSQFLKFHGKSQKIIGGDLFDSLNLPETLQNHLHDQRSTTFKNGNICIEIFYLDQYAVLRFENSKTPEEQLLEFIEINAGRLLDMAVLPMRISMKKTGYDLFGEVLPGSPALPRFLDADGHNSGFVMLQIVEPDKDSDEPLQRGVVLFEGQKLKKVMRVNEKKFQGKGFYFKSLLIDEKNGTYSLNFPTHSEYLKTDYWELDDKVDEILKLYKLSRKKTDKE